MSKLTSALVLTIIVVFTLATIGPARANISDTIGNITDIDTVDLTDLATGKYRQRLKPKSRSIKYQNSPKKNLKKIDSKAKKIIYRNYPNKFTPKQSLTQKRGRTIAEINPFSTPEMVLPFDLPILSDLSQPPR
jgi:hypothetical protein